MRLPHLLLLLSATAVPAAPSNLAAGKPATASSSGYGSVAADIADGNRDGGFYSAGSVWHSVIPDAAPWVEVDLGADYYLDRVMLWPRTDAVQGTVKDIRVKVTNAAGTVVYNTIFLAGQAAANPWGTTTLRGTVGRKVRIERADAPVNPNFLTFAELEVHGQSNPIPANLALDKPRTAVSPGAYGTPLNAGNDGIIDGDYARTGRPVYHSGVTAVGDYYDIDLSNGAAVNQTVDLVRLFNRTDHTNNNFLKLSLRDTSGAQVWTQTVNVARETLVAGGRQYDITVDFPGTVQARYARVETVGNEPLVFAELEVFGPEQDIMPPEVTDVDPPAEELVAELYQTTVTFSEAVAGVNAADLTVNGAPCALMTPQSASVYLFAFTQPANGPVNFAWAGGHGITDGGGNAFAGGTWTVTLDTALPAPQPYVSEIMADNKGGLEDADGESPDWIEITNPGPTALNLGGWYLTDDPAALTKWQFPSPVVVPAGTSIVVFASSKNRRVTGADLHTNFKLDPNGESVLLVKPDGLTVASSILHYPPQRENVSFGIGRRLNASPSITAGAAAKVLIPSAQVTGWTVPAFNDSAWTSATTGVGYDQGGAGPLGWWDFSNNAAPSQAADASGHGLTGTVLNASYTADAGGHTGLAGDRAMNFAGNGVVNITGANSTAFDAITSANGVAISAWIYGAAAQPAGTFLFFAGSNADGSGTRVLDAHVPWSDSVIYWDTAGCCDGGRQRISFGDPNPDHWRGRWNHYVLQKDGERKEIWQNGALLHSGINTDAMMNLRSLYIGAQNAAGSTGYQGMIDDFAIWDGALTPVQIAALANRTATPATVRTLAPLLGTDIGATMRNVNASALVRLPFTVSNPASLNVLELRMRYDDGFVTWLNGIEIARRNAPAGAVPALNARATAARTGSAAFRTEIIDVSRYAALLTPGTNVLAIQGLNASAGDADFLLLPELVAGSAAEGRYFASATPGALNDEGVTGFVADTVFSPNRGFYDTPQTVTISCATPGSIIVITTDGSIPTLTNGTQSPSPATVPVTTTTTLRAAAFVPASDLGPANVDTHTYLFVNAVPGQTRPAAAPVTWPGGHSGDYAMDPRIVTGAQPGYTVRDALLAIPTLSITTTPGDIWGAGGIYANSGSRGDAWERAASAEWLEPSGADGFHIDFGLAIHGNISRDKGFTPKHSLKMFFRSQYGETKLRHPLFPGSPVEEFDQLILRAGSTDTFPCTEWGPVGLGPNGTAYQRWARAWASYIRDQWVRDTQIAMGQLSARGRYCHVYLNGIYWGLYNVCEHPDEDFQADHLGGSPADYDVLVDFAELKNGDYTAWQQLMSLSTGSASDAAFQQMQGNNPDGTRNATYPILLNADSLVDYMILHIFHGADDWPNHNWWAGRATRNTTSVNDGFHWFSWDQEISCVNVLYERTSWQSFPALRTDVSAANTPAQPYYALRQGSPEFRMRFADRVHRHLFNNGALTTTNATNRWYQLIGEIDKAIVAESARWGDYQANLVNPGQPYRREVEWLNHLFWMAANYWPQINGVTLQRFRDANLYPALHAPVISQFGGYYLPGFTAALSHTNGTGSIRYTLDGTDPRLLGGAPNPAALTYTAPVSFSGTQTVKARVLNGTTWSALLETTFIPHPDRDSDGIPNDWESAYALNPDNPADAAQDSDGDGSTNAQEYAADTDPRDGALTFTAASFTDAEGLHIQFTAKAGRAYRLETSGALTAWSTLRTRAARTADEPVDWIVPPTDSRRYFRVVATGPTP
jgi:hypothetical protein